MHKKTILTMWIKMYKTNIRNTEIKQRFGPIFCKIDDF